MNYEDQVTMLDIDALPHLGDIPQHSFPPAQMSDPMGGMTGHSGYRDRAAVDRMEPPSQEKMSKSIRRTYMPPAQSGMSFTSSGAPFTKLSQLSHSQEQYNSPNAPPYNQPYHSPPSFRNAPQLFNDSLPTIQPYHPEIEAFTSGNQVAAAGSCLDVHGHVTNCPICTKMYSLSDKLVYLIIIGILAIACLILLKKVLDRD